MPDLKKLMFMMAFFVLMNSLDVFSTGITDKDGFRGRGVPEGNSWNVYFQTHWGAWWWIPKMTMTLAVCALAYFVHRFYSNNLHLQYYADLIGIAVLFMLSFYYVIVVVRNSQAGR